MLLSPTIGPTVQPRIEREDIDLIVGACNPVTGELVPTKFLVEVVSVHPILDDLGGSNDQQRWVHRWISSSDKMRTFHSDRTPGDGRIFVRIIRGITPTSPPHRHHRHAFPSWPPGKSQCLSITIYRAFDGLDDQAATDAFLMRAREAAPQKSLKNGNSKTRNIVGGLKNSMIRTNRVAGPFGHCNGRSINGLRAQVLDRNNPGAVPRNPVACIVVPVDSMGDKVITSLIPFYAKTRQVGDVMDPNDNVFGGTRISHPPRHAPPARGYVAKGHRLLRIVGKACDKDSHAILARTIASRVTSASILAKLPQRLETSRMEADHTLHQYAFYFAHLKSGDGHLHGEDDIIEGEDLPFNQGDSAMYQKDDSDDFHSCIVMSSFEYGGERHYRIRHMYSSKEEVVNECRLHRMCGSHCPVEDEDLDDPKVRLPFINVNIVLAFVIVVLAAIVGLVLVYISFRFISIRHL